MSVLSFMAKRLRDGGRHQRTTVRKPPRRRLALEALDDRILLSITEFPIPAADSNPFGITRGPDGNLWFTESLAGRIGRITPGGVITEFSAGITPGGQPGEITAGPDGNLWFTEQFPDRIGRITPRGVITEFSAGIAFNSQPLGITAGPDGNLWFTEQNGNAIGRITTAGVVTVFSAGLTPNDDPALITAGPDSNLWFTEGDGKIGRITRAGVITEFSAGITGGTLFGITAGPDGNLWFTNSDHSRIGRITPAGQVTEFAGGSTAGSVTLQITAGPDGNLWFTEPGRNLIGRLTTAGVLNEFSAGIAPGAAPGGIAVGADGNIWFTEIAGNRIGRLDLAQAGAVTTTTLRTSAPIAVFGQPATLTATVSSPAGTPTGTVIFKDLNTVLGTAPVNAAGQATLTRSLGVGVHSLTASFVGNSAFAPSRSAFVTETVNRAATTVALSPSINPTGTGHPVTFTATVSAVAPGAGSPTGTVTFFDGSVMLGTAAVGAGRTATLTRSFAVQGNHAITAVYSGDGNFLAGSRAVTESVLATTTTGATAAFVTTDVTTQGNSRTSSVADGFDLEGDASAANPRLPAYAALGVAGSSRPFDRVGTPATSAARSPHSARRRRGPRLRSSAPISQDGVHNKIFIHKKIVFGRFARPIGNL
jgi:streptogramin lyase